MFLCRLFNRLFKSEKITGTDPSDLLLVRWFLLRFRKHRLLLHHFRRSDADDPHSHPWDFWSLVIRGGYFEFVPDKAENDPRPIGQRRLVGKWYGPGSILYRRAEHVHRVELPPGRTSWTIVFTFPKRREWGFFTRVGYKPWRVFFAENNIPQSRVG